MRASSRIVGLVVFIALVATIQVVENLYRWHVHRDDRMHLSELRDELVDVGAAMIEAQLEMQRIRSAIERFDRELGERRIQVELTARTDGARPGQRRTPDAGVDGWEARLGERNRWLDDLNEAVTRRNSAASRYGLLADSIRGVARRARDPYFAIPLPAEAAAQRGITPDQGGAERTDLGAAAARAVGGR